MQKKKVYDALLPLVGESRITDVAYKVFDLIEEAMIETELEMLDKLGRDGEYTAEQAERVREIMRQAIRDVDSGKLKPSRSSIKCHTCNTWVGDDDARHPCWITRGAI